MDSEELVKLMEAVEEKGLKWEAVQEKTKVPKQILDLYVNSGPVPVTLINNMKSLLETPSE
ncbi:MAG: hypothetical protein U5R49_08270 [Deltaproteobacteria bacterium]|nr:hypothetical protein [Deltaproteobacteria bacterium]